MTRNEQLLAWLERNRDRDIIKLITGVRGCGKSDLIGQYQKALLSGGVSARHVIHINLEHPQQRHIHDPGELLDAIERMAPAKGRVYLILDEICELQEFEVAIGGLFAMKRFDLLVVCSNKRPLSDRFKDYLAGRFVHMEMTPPPFREIPCAAGATFEDRLEDWLRFGAMPYTFRLRNHEDGPRYTSVYLGGLWNTILVKDILTRNRLSDSRLTERLLERIYEHLGESESLRKIAADATVDGRVTAPNTVDSYLAALDESMLVRKFIKFDVFTGDSLRAGYKFYLADLALGRNRYGEFPGDPTNAVRNLIALELWLRKGQVFCGRYDSSDFDFAVIENGKALCWQYVPKLVGGKVPAPLFAAFRRMPRDQQKVVIVRRDFPKKPVPGVEFISLENFLLGKG